MTQRLRVIYKNTGKGKTRYDLSKKYFEKLKKETKSLVRNQSQDVGSLQSVKANQGVRVNVRVSQDVRVKANQGVGSLIKRDQQCGVENIRIVLIANTKKVFTKSSLRK